MSRKAKRGGGGSSSSSGGGSGGTAAAPLLLVLRPSIADAQTVLQKCTLDVEAKKVEAEGKETSSTTSR